MCNYTQREYACGHFRWIASKWCEDYAQTWKRCPPKVDHTEYYSIVVCGTCVEPPPLPPMWEAMIKRPRKRRAEDDGASDRLARVGRGTRGKDMDWADRGIGGHHDCVAGHSGCCHEDPVAVEDPDTA